VGPLLFNLFMADLEPYLCDSSCIGCKLQCNDILNLSFADDFSFLSESETMLQRMLSSLLTYCLYSKLEVNTDKSKIMVVQRRKKATTPDPTFLFDGKPLEIVKEYKYLGLMFYLTEQSLTMHP